MFRKAVASAVISLSVASPAMAWEFVQDHRGCSIRGVFDSGSDNGLLAVLLVDEVGYRSGEMMFIVADANWSVEPDQKVDAKISYEFDPVPKRFDAEGMENGAVVIFLDTQSARNIGSSLGNFQVLLNGREIGVFPSMFSAFSDLTSKCTSGWQIKMNEEEEAARREEKKKVWRQDPFAQ